MAENKAPIIVPLRDDSKEPGIEERDFQIYRRDREISFLKGELARKNAAIRHKDRVLAEHNDLWDMGLNYDLWPTTGQALKLKTQTKNAIEYEGPAYAEPEKVRRWKRK